MKKMLGIIGLAVIFLSLASLAPAVEYKVKRGDCLSAIERKFKVPWREIADINGIKKPYIIYPGQELDILTPGSENTIQQAAAVQVPAKASTKYLDEIRALRAEITKLEEKLNQTSAPAAVATTETELTTVKRPCNEVKTAYDKKVDKPEEISKKDIYEKKAISTDELKEQAVATPQIVEQAKSRADDDQFNLYMSVGGWKSYDNEKVSRGQFVSTKFRYRPFSFDLFDHEVGTGGFLAAEIGSGKTGIWGFGWYKAGLGSTSKVYGQGWDTSTDLGVARQLDIGDNDEQFTDSWIISQYVNLEQRRASGKKWFPQTELMFSGNIPYSAHKESTKPGKTYGKSLEPADKLVYGAELKQSIYDFNFDNHLRLTPGLMIGGGYEADNGYHKYGSFVKLAYYGQDILTLDVFGKKKQTVKGGRVYAILSADVDGIRQACERASISEAKPSDLTVK